MRLLRSDTESRRWLQDLLFYMLNEADMHSYCYTFHNVELLAVKQPFAFIGGMPALGGVSLDSKTERLVLLIYHPTMSRLHIKTQLAILQHEAIHIIDGHLSTYGLRLKQEYGQTISGFAMDMYVNQKIDTQPMVDDGFIPVTVDQYGFPPGLSSEDYCKLLQDGVNNGTIQLPEQPIILIDGQGRPMYSDGTGTGDAPPQDPQTGTSGKPGDDFTGKGQPRPVEIFDLTKENAQAADQATREVISSVEATLKEHKQAWGRGFKGADHAQFIESAKRESAIPWSFYLRMMEANNRAEVVVPTRRRLSRRSEYHLGRVRRYGLDVVFMIDTSGSMGAEQLRLVDPELRGIHSRGAHIRVIHCDTQVAKIEEYSPHSSLEQFHGRGGTEFSDALIKTRELYPRPGMFVGYTDGYGGVETYRQLIEQELGHSWWDEYVETNPTYSPDGVETLWLIPEGCMSPEDFRSSIVPWGMVAVVPREADVSKAS